MQQRTDKNKTLKKDLKKKVLRHRMTQLKVPAI